MSQFTLCTVCHKRPKYVDPSSGQKHNFCGRTCAQRASGGASSASSAAPPVTLCLICQLRPQYFDGIKTHPFCGRTCAGAAPASITHSRKPSRSGTSGLNRGEICISCTSAPQSGSLFCTRCYSLARANGPVLVEIPSYHAGYKSVEDQFKKTWRHKNKPVPAVKKILKIMESSASCQRYENYRANVETRSKCSLAGKTPGNQNRRWHGTHRHCKLGDQGQTQLCSDGQCSLCCIIRTSFDIAKFGKKTGWGRFGRGIYTTSTSSKADDYSKNICSSQWKAVILTNVVVGRGFKVTQDNQTLQAPPKGYDSVLAEVGKALNYDECVVYNNDAVRPSYIVMYEI